MPGRISLLLHLIFYFLCLPYSVVFLCCVADIIRQILKFGYVINPLGLSRVGALFLSQVGAANIEESEIGSKAPISAKGDPLQSPYPMVLATPVNRWLAPNVMRSRWSAKPSSLPKSYARNGAGTTTKGASG